MKIIDDVNIKGINYVDTSLYFLDSSVSIYRDAAHNLVFDDFFNTPKTLSQMGGGDVTKAYVDASLSLRDTSIDWLANNMSTQTYVDASLNNIRASFIPNSSLNQSKFKWVTNLLEPSGTMISFNFGKNSADGNNAQTNTISNGGYALLQDSSYIYMTAGTTGGNWRINASVGSGGSDLAVGNHLHRLNQLSDVSIISAADLQMIQYEASTLKWKNVDSVDIADVLLVVAPSYVNSSSYYDGSLNLKVNKSGDTMTGDLSINTKLFIGQNITAFNPYILPSSGNTAYVFDTSSTLLAGDYLAEFNNKGITASYIDYQGGTYGKSFNAYSTSTNYSALNLNDIRIVTLGGNTRVLLNPTVTDDASAVAHVLDTNNSLTGTASLLSVRNLGVEKFNISCVGNMRFAGAVDSGITSDYTRLASSFVETVVSSSQKMILNPTVADSAAAKAYTLSTSNVITNGKLLSIQNNNVEKFYIDASGTVVGSNVRKIAKQILTDQATIVWDMTISATAQVTLAASRILDVSGTRSGDNGTLLVIQGGSGSYALTLPSGSLTQGGLYSLSTAVASKDILSFFFDGSNYFWNIGKSYS